MIRCPVKIKIVFKSSNELQLVVGTEDLKKVENNKTSREN